MTGYRRPIRHDILHYVTSFILICIRIISAYNFNLPVDELLEFVYVNHRLLWRWKHKVIMTTAVKRYLKLSADIKKTQKEISNLFLDVWWQGKPLVPSKKQRNIFNNGCRYVMPHLLEPSITTFNSRLMNELSAQLLHSGW